MAHQMSDEWLPKNALIRTKLLVDPFEIKEVTALVVTYYSDIWYSHSLLFMTNCPIGIYWSQRVVKTWAVGVGEKTGLRAVKNKSDE